MEPRVAVYLRISTDQQNHDSQRLELEQYCERRNWKSVEWFEEVGSGAKQNREKLNYLMDQARRGKIDIVVAFKLDRLARSLKHWPRSSRSYRLTAWHWFVPVRESTPRTRILARSSS